MYHKQNDAVNDEGETFKEWMTKVDRELESLCGLCSLDLADVDYWNMWDWSEPHRDAAIEVLKENDFPMSILPEYAYV